MAVTVASIPTDTSQQAQPFDVRIVLTGKPYNLRFQWSTRGQYWLLSLYDDGGALLAGSLPIRNGCLLTLPYRADAALPPGQFLPLASTFPDIDAQTGDLGSRVVLYYVEAS